MRFESQKNIDRENKAIRLFSSIYNLSFEKLGENDIDFKIFKGAKAIAYLEVKGRHRDLSEAFPLPVAVAKIDKLKAKGLKSVIVWGCNDGIIFGDVDKLEGIKKLGGRKPRAGASNDIEQMYYFNDVNLVKKHYDGD